MILTVEILEKGKSIRGAFSEAQLNVFGETFKKNKGWLKKLVGKEVTEKQIEDFLNLKDEHLKNKQKYKDKFSIENLVRENMTKENVDILSTSLKFEDVYKDISRINKNDPATHAERLGKFFEEAGELAKAINKTNGRKVLKDEDTFESINQEVLDEAADSVQNVVSIIDGFGFTCEDLVKAIANKNKKWEKKVNGK